VVERHSWACSDRPRGLDVVPQLLQTARSLAVRPVRVAHHDLPDAAGDPPGHRVPRVHLPLEMKNDKVRREVVDLHPAGQERLHVGERIGG
jgi:hypothetical protein